MRATVRLLLAVGLPLAAVAASPARAQPPARRIIPLVRARAVLETTLDAKKATPGEVVRARLQTVVPIPNGPTLPRNTILLGHVDQVQASQHRGNSSLVITFDQAKLKKGELLTVKVTVYSIAEPASPGAADTSAADDGSLADASSDTPRPTNFAPPPGANLSNPPIQTPQSQSVPLPVPQAPRTRGVPGVTLITDMNRPTSATFLSQRHNVHVSGGVEMGVAVGIIPKVSSR
jgi:hypothetical protein